MDRRTIEAYDRGAEFWLESRYDAKRRRLEPARAFRQAVGAGLILDLGCGPGKLFEDLGEPTIGIDASTGMLALAAGHDGSRLIQADMEVLPVADHSVAGAWANFSFQHLSRVGFNRALREARRVLEGGGLLELTVHRADRDDGFREDDDMPLGRWFSYWRPEDLHDVLDAAGFVDVDIQLLESWTRARARAG